MLVGVTLPFEKHQYGHQAPPSLSLLLLQSTA
jgi:hypothetical protein